MFEGFERKVFDVGDGVRIHGVIGGSGPPLLLLHGYPQTHAIWHKIAPKLAQRYTVVATDLRGYGDSSKPESLPDHGNYSKRVMGRDQLEVMRQLGFERFLLCGHDRGARVSHRLAMDHPDAVEKIVVLDIAPTLAMYQQTTMQFAQAYYHWFFLIQPAPFPERLIGVDPAYYLEKKMGSGSAKLAPFTPEAFESYSRAFTPETIRATCEDYRAAASIDLEHDRTDQAANKKLEMPLLVLWGKHGVIERCFDPLSDWKAVAGNVRGMHLPGGHYLAEELPDLVLQHLETFFDEII